MMFFFPNRAETTITVNVTATIHLSVDLWFDFTNNYARTQLFNDYFPSCANPLDKTATPLGTCSDLTMNGDETDVDCGGSCDACTDPNLCVNPPCDGDGNSGSQLSVSILSLIGLITTLLAATFAL